MKDFWIVAFIFFCLLNAFPITVFNCDKAKGYCTCKQYLRLEPDYYNQIYFNKEDISNIKYAVAFRSSNHKFKEIGFRLKDSKKNVFYGAIVDRIFYYDLFTPPADKFVKEFNIFLDDDTKQTFQNVHISGFWLIAALLMLYIFYSLKRKL